MQSVSVAVPPLHTAAAAGMLAEFPLIVQSVSVAVPIVVHPAAVDAAEFPLMVQSVSVAVPSNCTPRRRRHRARRPAEFPLMVQSASIAVPRVVYPAALYVAEFPLMVQSVSVAVPLDPSVVHPAAGECRRSFR